VSSRGESGPFGDWFGRVAEMVGGDRWRPAADVYETEKAIVVRLELAGVASADVHVSVDGDVLRIRGVREVRVDRDAQRLHQMEIASGPFERILRIGIPFERGGVSAQLEDGFLRVTLPKRSTRRIDVEGAPGPAGERKPAP
jgi:HSP20 family protein